MLAVRTPGASQAARYSAGCDSAFPFARQGRLLRSRSISGLCSRSLHSGLQPPCLRFATAVTGRHARLGSRLLARLCRVRHRRRQTSTRLQGANRVIGGGRPPPIPTERGVRISRTTLFGSWFTAFTAICSSFVSMVRSYRQILVTAGPVRRRRL